MTVDSPQPAVQRLPGPSTNLASPDGSSVPPTPRSGGAKVRVLETATRLFYEEGIHSVGVDRLISEASVTKATFYKHYGSKDNLILRGCAFLHAAAEYHDPRDPVRQVVAVHRDWYTERLATLLQEAGHPLPGDGADELMLARDGAMAGAYAGLRSTAWSTGCSRADARLAASAVTVGCRLSLSAVALAKATDRRETFAASCRLRGTGAPARRTSVASAGRSRRPRPDGRPVAGPHRASRPSRANSHSPTEASCPPRHAAPTSAVRTGPPHSSGRTHPRARRASS
ncbi:MAG: TetR family transcriptional regulator [Microbacterium sp.]|nr:TetR family transcriptional regulator [Microbacterium sp.]